MTQRKLNELWETLGIPAAYPRLRGLPVQREARRLVSIGPALDDGRPVRLTSAAAQAWRRMCDAAAADSVCLLPLSGFRSVARQTRLIRRKLKAGEAIADILRLMAAPGCSEHHTGRAIDIGSPTGFNLEEAFARTREYRWLRRHAVRFGFRLSYPKRNSHGIAYEPWHWCWHKEL